MDRSGFIDLVPYLISFSISAAVGLLVWRRREVPGAGRYAAVSFFQAWWIGGYICELLAGSEAGKIFWDNLQFIGTVGWAVLFFYFSVEYSGQQLKRAPLILTANMVIVGTYIGLAFTNPYHHILYTNERMIAGVPFAELTYSFQPAIWVAFAYLTVLNLWALYFLLAAFRSAHRMYRAQAGIITLGFLAPLIGMALALAGVQFTFHRDTSPFYFGVSSLVVGWGLLRYRLFDLVPVARGRVLEELKDAVVVVDPEDRIMDLNPAALQLIGRGSAQVLGRPAGEALASFAEVFVRFPGLALVRDEVTAVDTDSGRRYFETSIFLLPGPRGRSGGKVIVARDVTGRQTAQAELRRAHDELERKVVERTRELSRTNRELTSEIEERRRAEAALAESETKYRLIADNATDMIWTMGLDLMPTYVSPAVMSLRGYSVEEAMGQSLSELLPPASLAAATAVLREEVDRWNADPAYCPAARTLEVEVYRKDGSVVWTETRARLLGRDGPAAVLGVTRDISERKALESQLLQSQKMEAIGRLAGGVAHDFNNHLMVIINMSELLQRSMGPSDPRRRQLDLIRQAGDKAAGLTRQLLAFSRKQVIEPRPIHLNKVIEDLRKMLARLIGEDIDLQLKLGPESGWVMMDPVQVEQVIFNLAVNARDAMPRGGKLVIETRDLVVDGPYTSLHPDLAPGSYVMLSLTDTGVGMDSETRKRIFEPFFTTKGKEQGTGLGLAMVYAIVKQSGGAVEVYSEPGTGSTFKVLLPRVDESGSSLEPVRPAAAPGGRGEIVLLVEDDELARETALSLLATNGYEVIEAKSGEEALTIFQKRHERISLIVSDVVLTGITGREVIDRARAVRPDLRALLLSGYSEDIVSHRGGLEAGVDFMQKPFNSYNFLIKVREVLDRGAD